MQILFIVLGLILCLIGAFIAGELPIKPILDLARCWGGPPKEESARLQKEMNRKLFWSRVFLVLGTFLQIIGSL